MKHIELNDRLFELFKEKISHTERGYIHIHIQDKRIVFIGFETTHIMTRMDTDEEGGK